MPEPVDIVELRVLDGPNLYFTRPAIKLTLAVPGWMRATEPRLERLATEIELPGRPRPGARGSEQRRRFVARVGAHVTRSLARASSVRLGVRARTGPARRPDRAWRSRGGDAMRPRRSPVRSPP